MTLGFHGTKLTQTLFSRYNRVKARYIYTKHPSKRPQEAQRDRERDKKNKSRPIDRALNLFSAINRIAGNESVTTFIGTSGLKVTYYDGAGDSRESRTREEFLFNSYPFLLLI